MTRSRRLRIVIRWRAARTRMSRFVGGSIAAHAVLLAAALVLPMTRHAVAPIQDSMVVSLSGPIGGSAPAPAPAKASPAVAAAPAAPAPAPPPKQAHAVREIPAPKPKPKDKPDSIRQEPPKAPQDPAPAAEHPAADAKPSPADGGAPGAGPGSGAPGSATGVTATLGGGDSALGWYGAAVKAALESAWSKPYIEDQGQTYSVVVAFDIARDGTTRNVRVVQTSGIPSLDRSAQRAVIEASPLPAVPPTWKDDTLPATMRFDLNPESP